MIGHGPAQDVNMKSRTVIFSFSSFSENDSPFCVVNKKGGTSLITGISWDELAFWITQEAPTPKRMIQSIIVKIFLFIR
jgi:hypothetical protein